MPTTLRAFATCATLACAVAPSLGQPTPRSPADDATSTSPANALDPIYVQGQRYKTPFNDPPPFLYRPGFPLPPLPPFGYKLSAYVVTAARTPEVPAQVTSSTRVLDTATLRSTPAVTLDGALRSVPGFSLFRRSDSLTANPTAQGVSLRGLGPSGASRTLVLLDGVPLNDPFGGWVAWTKFPREEIARTEMVSGGGGTAWGNAALGGVIQLLTVPPRTEPILVKAAANVPGGGESVWGAKGNARLNTTFGDYSTRSAEVEVTEPTAHGAVQLLGRDFSTDGFTLVAPERHGPIDVAAWSRHRWIAARWREQIRQKYEFTAMVRGYEEFRGNGTPYTRNGSREKFASATLAGQPADNFAWNAVAYVQDQSFASTFSSVNATRTAETPASDQFAVPATAFGAAWTGALRHNPAGHTSFGADVRTVRGETRENFTFVNGAYTRQRIAGGKQNVGGLFAQHERPLIGNVRVTLGVRLDGWEDLAGHRRETDRNTGGLLRNDRYADRSGTEFSPSLGLVWTPSDEWRLRANSQHAFRRPTLNELYRPFRQGTTVVETNSDLRTERVTTAEVGAEWTIFQLQSRPQNIPGTARWEPKPYAALTLGATAFWNDFRDAVGNVTLARGPGTFPLFGVLPAGGIGRQRLNLDRTRVQGLEFSASWVPTRTITVTGAILLNDATVRRASVAPTLVGRRVAQVPRRSSTLSATWRAPGKFTFTPRLRWIGRQFEDDENTFILGEAVVADLGLSRPLGKNVELFLNVENVGNARLETGRSADGVVNIGTPRLALGGFRASW